MNTKEYKAERLRNYEGVQLTDNTYNLTIGLVLFWGILLDFLMAKFFTPQIIQINYIIILIAYLVMSIGGALVVFKSSNPVVSFIAFTVLALGMGLLLTYFLYQFDGHTIYTAFLLTGIITVAMMIASTLFPAFFKGLGKGLGIALLIALAVEIIGGLIFRLPLDFMDYGMVLLFAGYVGFDWARAQEYPKTLDNAIDSAADIFVDIVNIFIRILSIMARNKD